MNWRVPFSDIDFDDRETEAVVRTLQGKWLTQGAETEAFEAGFRKSIQAHHAVAVSNATAALHLALAVLGAGPGDEVLVPSLTFVATINAVLYVGARPVFVEVRSPDDLTIDPDDLERKRTPRTRGVVVMHYGGYACDMVRITSWARRHGLFVVEDAAHCPGATLEDRSLGTWGDVGCFSFFANKNMTTGEGGMVVTADAALATRLRHLRSHGMTAVSWDRHKGQAFSNDVVELGYNYRTTEIASALGNVQLAKLAANNERRARLVAAYRERLSGVSIPFSTWRGTPAHHLLPVLLKRPQDRHAFMSRLKENGIQSSIHYPPAHLFSYHRQHLGTGDGLLPLTEDISSRLVTLPLFPHMTVEQVDLVVASVRSAL